MHIWLTSTELEFSFSFNVATFFNSVSVAIIVIMGMTLFSGVFHCGWICPYGTVQDLFSKLGRLMGIKKRKMPVTIQKILVFSRYIILGSVLLIGSTLVFSIMSYDPRVNLEQLLLGNVITTVSIGVICFFLFIALFFERPFCNYFCFEGAKYGLMSSTRLFTIKRNISTCINCKECDMNCPMNITVSKCTNLRSPQCINCFQCISSCPVENTLNYGRINMTTVGKKRYLALLVVAFILVSTFVIYNNYSSTDTSSRETNTTETLPSTSATTTVITGEGTKKLGDAEGIADGVYTGKGEGFNGIMTVQVTVKDQQIIGVVVQEHRDDRKWFYRANDVIPDKIIETQTTDINMVSGATYSSMGIISSVKDALNKAK